MKKGTIVMEILKEANPEISLKVAEKFDPKEFFQDRDGLSVYSGFKSSILSKARAVKKGAEYTIESLDLIQDAYDKQIEASLGNKNLFKESDVCAIIASLIQKQPKGETGELVTTGYSNLFYTKSCVVGVRWFGSRWLVGTWSRDGRGWAQGGRVFSPQLTLDL